MSRHIFSDLLVILTLIIATTFNSCVDKSIREQTVKDVMDQTVTKLYKTMSEKELDSLTNDQVMALFSDQEKNQFRQFRVKHKLPVKSIYSLEKGFMKDTADGVRLKISAKDFPMSAEIGIHNEAVRFLIFGKKPSAIMIKNADVAQTLSSLFKLAWETAEKKGQKPKKEK